MNDPVYTVRILTLDVVYVTIANIFYITILPYCIRRKYSQFALYYEPHRHNMQTLCCKSPEIPIISPQYFDLKYFYFNEFLPILTHFGINNKITKKNRIHNMSYTISKTITFTVTTILDVIIFYQ